MGGERVDEGHRIRNRTPLESVAVSRDPKHDEIHEYHATCPPSRDSVPFLFSQHAYERSSSLVEFAVNVFASHHMIPLSSKSRVLFPPHIRRCLHTHSRTHSLGC